MLRGEWDENINKKTNNNKKFTIFLTDGLLAKTLNALIELIKQLRQDIEYQV